MPRHRTHHVQKHRSQPKHSAIPRKLKAHTVQPSSKGHSISQITPLTWSSPQVIVSITAVAVTGIGGVVGLIRTMAGVAQRRREEERWAKAKELREKAEVEEHIADSAVRMLVAREKVAHAATSMYGATTNTYAAQSRALESKRFFEGVGANSLPSASGSYPLLLPPVSSSSLDSYTGINQSTVTSAALRAVIENGTDLTSRTVQNSWKQWEQRIRREHPSPTAQAIIDAAKTLLQEAN